MGKIFAGMENEISRNPKRDHKIKVFQTLSLISDKITFLVGTKVNLV